MKTLPISKSAIVSMCSARVSPSFNEDLHGTLFHPSLVSFIVPLANPSKKAVEEEDEDGQCGVAFADLVRDKHCFEADPEGEKTVSWSESLRRIIEHELFVLLSSPFFHDAAQPCASTTTSVGRGIGSSNAILLVAIER